MARESWAASLLCVASLARQLSAADIPLVLAGLGALARLQARAEAALPSLKPLLSHSDPETRWATLAAFAAVGPAAAAYVPDILPFLQDESAELRLAAADAMRHMRPPAPESEESLAARIAWLNEHVPTLMRDMHVPGVSIAIMQRGEVVWTRGFGVGDVRPGFARSVAAYRALGWSLDATPEGDIVEHSGSNSSGFRSFGQFNPAKGSGLVIFMNGDAGYRLRTTVIERIGDL